MRGILDVISNNMVEILTTVLTAIIGYIGIKAKSIFEKYINDKTKKSIVEETVKYVEQIGKTLSCEEKKQKAHDKALEWMIEKKINVSDTELEILIESAVNCL